MKKWVGLAAILISCGVYAMVKLSISRYPDANPQVEETPRAKQTEADDTKAATPEEESGSPATAAQIAAVTQAFGDFQNALERKDCEQAWMLLSESSRNKHSLEEFKKAMAEMGAVLAKATLRPESATDLGGRVRLLVTHPSKGDDHWFFVQENGQWKVDDL
jgi:hypothetical protein